jgi:4-hydroxybenzoate polyprenyltransferase
LNGALSQVHTWGQMIKFSHSLFALPFAIMAMFMAGRHLPGGHPSLGQGLLIVACMVLARSAAMTFNRLADAAIDARNPRTANRPLPTGRISIRAAWFFLAACCLLFVFCCCGFWWLDGNRWPAALSIPVLMLLCGYSYTKRFTRHSHFLLGAAIGLSPVAAWLAIHPPTLGWPALALMAVVVFWIGGFDIIYACQDIDVDRRDALHSLPAKLGTAKALWIARGAHVLTVAILLILWRIGGLGTLYLVGVGAVALLLLIENSLVRAGDLSRVNLAFFTVNGVIGVLLGVAAVTDILLTTN